MSTSDTAVAQLHLIDRARRYLRDCEARGIDVATSALCYMVSWTPVPGYAKLRFWHQGWSSAGKIAVIFAKDLVTLAKQGHREVTSNASPVGDYRQLVVTWAKQGDFRDDGSFQDRYFNTNSRDVPRALWFLVLLDGPVPARLDNNIRVFAKKPGGPVRDALFMLRKVAAAVLKRGTSPRRIPHELSSATVLASEAATAVSVQLRAGSFESVLLPYEAQPFHHAVFQAAKEVDAGIRTVGYLHSAPPPLPTDILLRSGAPDLLLVHGASQATTLETHLGWPTERLRLIPSLRYRRESPSSFAGQIFFPYTFFDSDLLVREFEEVVRSAAPASLPTLRVRNHPLMTRSKKHLRLQARMEEILGRYEDRFSANAPGGDLSVFIGATAALLEALERGVSVIHLCSQPVFEAHTEELWPCLAVEQLSAHIFRYRLRTPGQCIDLGAERDMFHKYCSV